jgi:hypothetical protein
MTVRLDNIDYLIAGIRIRVDAGQGRQIQSFKLLNRTIKLQPKGAIWYDLPLSDAEILYGSNAAVDCEFITDDPKGVPLRIYAVEVFAISKKDFNFKDKAKKLEKIKEKQLEAKNAHSETISNEETVKNEMTKTKGMPLLSWKEKN